MLSLAITTYNRIDLVIESFSKVYDHPMIDEIVICDDASETECFLKLGQLICDHPAFEKIKLSTHSENLGMSRNKCKAISKCKNDWVIILDSDNVLEVEYVDALFNLGSSFGETFIFCPQFAAPDYDFSDLPTIIDKSNAKDLLHIKEFRIFLNTCNYVVNKEKYLEVYRYNQDIKESDTIWFNYLWLKAGYSFYIVPGMKYFHRRHAGSGWLNGDHEYNLKKADELQNLIKEL